MSSCYWVLLFFITRSELCKILFLALSVTFLFVYEMSTEHWTDLHQTHTEDVFGPLLGWVWISGSKVKATTDKNGVFGGCRGNCWMDLRQIYAEDMFGPSLGRVWRSRSILAACVIWKNIRALVWNWDYLSIGLKLDFLAFRLRFGLKLVKDFSCFFGTLWWITSWV